MAPLSWRSHSLIIPQSYLPTLPQTCFHQYFKIVRELEKSPTGWLRRALPTITHAHTSHYYVLMGRTCTAEPLVYITYSHQLWPSTKDPLDFAETLSWKLHSSPPGPLPSLVWPMSLEVFSLFSIFNKLSCNDKTSHYSLLRRFFFAILLHY